MNFAVTEWNDELPDEVTRLSEGAQQKSFSNAATETIRPMQSLSAHNVNDFKRSTLHLHNCNSQGMVLVLIKRIISEELRQTVASSVAIIA
jgi:hypothetical protein